MQRNAAVAANGRVIPESADRTTTGPSGKTVRSADGTAIAFERTGHGPPVILVDGALCYRALGQSSQLARLLAPHFTVFTYDRRGRGASADTEPYAVAREVDDIAALLQEAGGEAFVWGISSGAVLALEAASRLPGIKKLALYEAPLVVDGSRSTMEESWARIAAAVASGRKGEAVTVFLQAVGVPRFAIALMRWMPIWSKLKSIAHTLPYDGAIVQNFQRGVPLPLGRWASVNVPTLVMDGGKSPTWMHHANRSLAQVLSNAEYRSLDDQTHMLNPARHAPVLVEFFARGP